MIKTSCGLEGEVTSGGKGQNRTGIMSKVNYLFTLAKICYLHPTEHFCNGAHRELIYKRDQGFFLLP